MNRAKRLLLTALGLLALSLPLAAPLAAQNPAVLGASGEVYMTRADTFAKLFPGKTGIDPTWPALALEIARPGAPTRRVLVPETEGIEIDTACSLLFEETSGTLFVAWESRAGSTRTARSTGAPSCPSPCTAPPRTPGTSTATTSRRA